MCHQIHAYCDKYQSETGGLISLLKMNKFGGHNTKTLLERYNLS